MLTIDNVVVRFGRVTALDNVSNIERAHEAYEILERLGLAEHAYQLADGLPYGRLKRIGSMVDTGLSLSVEGESGVFGE